MNLRQRKLSLSTLLILGQLATVIATLGLLTDKFEAYTAAQIFCSGFLIMGIPLYMEASVARVLSALTEFNMFQIISLLGAWATDEFVIDSRFWLITTLICTVYTVVFSTLEDT